MIEAAVVYESQSFHPRNLKEFLWFLICSQNQNDERDDGGPGPP